MLKVAQSSNKLNIKAVNTQPMIKWFGPGELPVIPPPIAVLRRPRAASWIYSHMLNNSFRRENALLRVFEEKKQQELNMENYMMKKTGKTRQSLLIRKQQHLPHIEHAGQEITRMKVERTETPDIIYDTDMFSEAAHALKEKNGICRRLTRREKGFNVITDWVGCPEVTDIIADKLGLRYSNPDKIYLGNEERQTSSKVSEFIPIFEELGLVGMAYEKVQQQMKEIVPLKTTKEATKGGLLSEQSKLKPDSKMYSNATYSTKESGICQEEPNVGLIIGQIKLFWTRDQERAKKKWVIDLGCVAEIGKDSIGSITMKNIGSTAVHFKWEKIQPINVFNLEKYGLRRFGFDCWGSVILPGEVFRLPVLYKCIEPGFFSEDWRLITLPVLENGAEIITRLWGITRQYDPYRRVRQEIDEDLEKKMAREIVDHRVTKIVDYLPLKEVPLKETRFPLVHLGPDLFHLNNPWLQYHCASVYRLGKLAAMTEKKTILNAGDKSRMILTYLDECMSDISIPQKPTHYGSDEQLARQSLRYPMFYLEDDGNVMKHGMYADGSNYSDEAEVSVHQIKRLIEELITPEVQDAAQTTKEPAEDEVEYLEAVNKSKHPLAVNLANPDISVDQIRQNILTNVVDSEEHKEAHFLIMTEQVTRLLARTDMPVDNWKTVVAQTLLYSKIDAFSEFAICLKDKCCQGQLLQGSPRKVVPNAGISEQSIEEEISQIEDYPESSSNTSAVLSETILTCMDIHPSRALQYLRYQDQYYSRLLCRMYSLLAEYVDDLDNLLSEVQQPQDNSLSKEEVVFTRVRNIPMNFNVEDALNAPLPPKWVKMAQRIDSTVQKNRALKESVNEGL